MAAAHSRANGERSKLNSEVLAHQQARAAERMRWMRVKQKEIFTPQVELDTSAFSTVQLKGKLMKKVLKDEC